MTVSMNLVDHEVDRPARGVRRGRAERAGGDGMRDHGERDRRASCPSRRSAPGDVEYLRLRGFDPDRQILERLLDAADDEE